jgi:HD-GYP domain-containing protein (c-di-GMP phosphodiesterase class II)
MSLAIPLRPWLYRRLTWGPSDGNGDRRKETAARAALYLLGGGGLLGLVSQLVPGAPGRDEAIRTAICLAAIALGLVAAIGFDRLPDAFFHFAPAATTGLITSDVMLSRGGDIALPYLFLVTLYAVNFLTMRAALFQVGLIAAALVVTVALQPAEVRADKGLVTFGVLAVAAYVILQANRRLRGLVAELGRSRQAIRASRQETIHRLSRAAEFRDEETGQHTRRMGEFCFVLARGLGLGDERADLIRLASPLHDVGKIAIPDRILLKPGPLTPAERAIMQEHTETGFELLTGSGQRLLDIAAVIALTRHERFDGTGYPHGLRGDAIALEGRIAAVADVFDALTSPRPYRVAGGVDDAVEAIRNGAGNQFDPRVVEAFLASLDEIREIRSRYSPAERPGSKAKAVA